MPDRTNLPSHPENCADALRTRARSDALDATRRAMSACRAAAEGELTAPRRDVLAAVHASLADALHLLEFTP